MKPIEEAEGLRTEIADAVGARKRRRMEEDASSSSATRIGLLRRAVRVVERQVLAGGINSFDFPTMQQRSTGEFGRSEGGE